MSVQYGFPMPENETHRLAVLDDLRLNFDQPLRELQQLCDLASEIAGTDIALVSLVGPVDQVFAANTGLDGVAGTSREVSFCAHTIMGSDQFVVPDACEDPRFMENPLVTGDPGIRAYAGTPLEPEAGTRIGALCVIDRKPRVFSPEVLRQLKFLAEAATALLVAHNDKLRLKEAMQESAAREAQVRQLSETDHLTNLKNGRYFWERLKSRVANGDDTFSLVLIDADHFKLINDRYGHAFGDQYLRDFATALQTSFAHAPLISRLGGDEFAVLLDGPTDFEGLQAFLNTVHTQIALELQCDDHPGLGEMSMGAALYPGHARTVDGLYQFADTALYMSKKQGRARCTVYSETLGYHFNLRLLRSDLESALRKHQIVPFFQPQVELLTGSNVGFEVLCRWDHPDRGLLAPAAFHPLLEDRQTAPMITHTILSQACRIYADMRDQGSSLGILAFNMTGHDLNDPEILHDMGHSLAEAGIPWELITVEVTETVVLGNAEGQAFRTMAALRERGVKIALDDYGTGYGSMHHLKSWPVDSIKLDREFTMDLPTNERDRKIVRALLALARDLGLETVAEGVETWEQAVLLKELGCTVAQGFLFAKPMSAAELETFSSAKLSTASRRV
jgi:diguanylate cyclase (GGDEF)-like protein